MSEANTPATWCLLGPTHPYTGGIAQHTTRLALELERRGHDVVVESWKSQYPSWAYKGQARLRAAEPEIGRVSRVVEQLTWFNPLSWWAAGWRNRGSKHVVVSVPTPFHALPYLTMFAALTAKTEKIGIVHNVLPHEPQPFQKLLVRALLRGLDRVIVHSGSEVDKALGLAKQPQKIRQLALPSPWIEGSSETAGPKRSGPIRLLFFGRVRHYKGLDRLITALASVDSVTLLVAGDFWEEEQEYRAQVARLGLEQRVEFRPGYVPESKLADVFHSADVLVLPYRSGTGSIVRELGFRFGLPVIASRVGAVAEGIRDTVTGLVVEPDDHQGLVHAITTASHRATVNRWKKNLSSSRRDNDQVWEDYCVALTGS